MLGDLSSHILRDVGDTHTMQMVLPHYSPVIQRLDLEEQIPSIHPDIIVNSFKQLDEEIIVKGPTSISDPSSYMALRLKIYKMSIMELDLN